MTFESSEIAVRVKKLKVGERQKRVVTLSSPPSMNTPTPLRRSPRLAALAAKAASTSKPVYKRKMQKRRAKDITPPVPQDTTRTKKPRVTMITEDDFNRFNDSLSDEDKEIQANLLMWCIMNSVPYTIALFDKYKHTIQQLMQDGLL